MFSLFQHLEEGLEEGPVGVEGVCHLSNSTSQDLLEALVVNQEEQQLTHPVPSPLHIFKEATTTTAATKTASATATATTTTTTAITDREGVRVRMGFKGQNRYYQIW